jgi:hypothetical protein
MLWILVFVRPAGVRGSTVHDKVRPGSPRGYLALHMRANLNRTHTHQTSVS